MNFLLDHDVPDDVVYSLLALGHDVHKLRDVLHGVLSCFDRMLFRGYLPGETARRL